MNSFLEKVFDTKSDYYILKMEDTSNGTDTYDGSVFVASFTLPREFWDKSFNDLTIAEYRQLERMTVDANICLSDIDYPPFQLGQTVCNVDIATPIEGKFVWKLIEHIRSNGVKRDYWSIMQAYEDVKAGILVKGDNQ